MKIEQLKSMAKSCKQLMELMKYKYHQTNSDVLKSTYQERYLYWWKRLKAYNRRIHLYEYQSIGNSTKNAPK